MSRFSLVDPDAMPDSYEAEAGLAPVYRRSSRHVGGGELQHGRVLRSLANNPEVLRFHTNAFLSLWQEPLTGLSPRETELVILATGRAFGVRQEWDSHIQNALTVGLTREEVTALAAGDFDALEPSDAALARYVTAVAEMAVTDEIHDELADHYDDRTMIGILVLAGYYALCAVVIDALDIEPADPGPDYADVGYEALIG